MTTIRNAADPTQVKAQQRKAKDQGEQATADLHALLKQPEFRRFIWRLINADCGLIGKSPFSTNGSAMTLEVGKQEIGRKLWTEIERADPLALPLMMTEYYQSREQA